MQTTIDLFDPEFRANPYPVYAALRCRQPVAAADPGGFWTVSRYADAQAVLRSPQIFSSAGFRAAVAPPWLDYNPIADSLLLKDPPEHGRLRALVRHAFSQSAIARMQGDMRRRARACVEALPAVGEVDLLKRFALPFPAQVIAGIVGIDPALTPMLKRWSDHLTMINCAVEDPNVRRAIRRSIAELEAYLRDVISERRKRPQEDLVSDLLVAKMDGACLSDREVLSFLFLLVSAGFETTMGLFCSSLRVLAARPDEMMRLRDDPGRIPAFIEEVLRYEPPVQGLFRLAMEDVTLSGTAIPAGATVMVLIASANRDEQRFAEPDRFWVDRPDQGHLVFGHGVHRCLGAALARMEVRIGLEEFLARYHRLERSKTPAEWVPSLTMRNPIAQPMRLLSMLA